MKEEKYYKQTDKIYNDIIKSFNFTAYKEVDYNNWWGSKYKVIGNTYMICGLIEHQTKISMYFKQVGLGSIFISATKLNSDDFIDGAYEKLKKHILELYNIWCRTNEEGKKRTHRENILSNI